VHVGGWNSGGTLNAHLSDNSAADYVDTTPLDSGVYSRNYALTYRASAPGQTLRVTWTMTSGPSFGNITLSGAALSTSTGSVTATAGTPQSTAVNTAFGTALQATVRDSGNAPLSGVTVTFTAPGSGASANFSGLTTATAVTDSNGIATAPALTANGTIGSYTVTAAVSGISTPASFDLSNTASPPASVTATAGTPQSTAVNTAFGTALQATVRDTGSNPVPGVTVTFTAPGTGASASFSGSATATAVTNSSGIATAPALTANGTIGSYTVTAAVSGIPTPANFSLSNTAAPVTSLTGSVNTSMTGANLTAEGPADWIHWGDASLNRRAGGGSQISTYTVLGGGSAGAYNEDDRPLSWTNGTPTASSSNNRNGVYVEGAGRGFAFTAPADATQRTLIVHVGGWNSGGTLTVQLSDGSAADYIDTTPMDSGVYSRNYTLTYRASAPGQTLRVTWTMTSGPSWGNITLSGAALSP
jgi:hypothetical protein